MTRTVEIAVPVGNQVREPIPKGDVVQAARGMSLHSNFVWTLAGNVVYAGCQWGMLVVLVKMGSPEMVGEFALAIAIITPILMLTNLQLRSVQATDSKHEYSFRDYFGLRLFMVGVALGTVVILTMATAPTQEAAAVILVIGIAKGIEAISEIYYGLFTQYERMDRISISLLLKGFSSLILFSLAIYLTHNIIWGTVALAFSSLVVLFAFDLPNAAVVGRRDANVASGVLTYHDQCLLPRWDFQTLLRLTQLALPLGLVMFLMSLSSNIPRYFIEQYNGLNDLGVFAAISYLIVAGGRIVSALGESSSPRLARYYATGEFRQFRSLLLRQILCGIFLGVASLVAAAVAGRELLTLVYGIEYADHTTVLIWVVIAGSLGYLASFLGYAMTAARFFFIQTPIFVAVGLSTAIACFFLVPEYGLVGAAWAVCVGVCIQLAGSSVVVAYSLKGLTNGSQP